MRRLRKGYAGALAGALDLCAPVLLVSHAAVATMDASSSKASAGPPAPPAPPPAPPPAAVEDDAFTKEFLSLVDAWLQAHPVTTHALSPLSVRFATAKLLLIKSGHSARLQWPGTHAARLAAILLVLMVHEGLLHGVEPVGNVVSEELLAADTDENGETMVLGVPLPEIYEIICDVLQTRRVTREELIAAVWDCDLDGSTTQLSQSAEFAAKLFGSAIDPAGGHPEALRVAKQVLRVHTLFAILGGVALIFFQGVGRTTFVCISLSSAAVSAVIVFPHDLGSDGACKMVFPSLCVTATVAVAVTGRSWYSLRDTDAMNPACRLVHALLVIGVLLNGGSSTLKCALRRYSWFTARRTLFCDGLLFFTAALLMRHFGLDADSNLWQPGEVTYSAAIARGLVTMFLGWPFLTPANRLRLKAIADRLGYEPLAHSLVRVLNPNDSLVTESARIHELSTSGLGAPLQRALRKQLARRYMRVRLLLCVLAGTWFVLADYLQLWTHLRISAGRTLFFGGSISAGLVLIAAAFPTNINTPAGRKFILPALAVCALCALAASSRSYFHDGRLTHVNFECQLIHAVLCISVVINWCSLLLICIRSKCTWGVIRTVLWLDGLMFFFCTGFLWLYGPPPVYQPRNASFSQAMLRAATTPLLSALLTPANRIRISSIANNKGWNHVTVTLNQVQRPSGRRVRFASLEPDVGEKEPVGGVGAGNGGVNARAAAMACDGVLGSDEPQSESCSMVSSSITELATNPPSRGEYSGSSSSGSFGGAPLPPLTAPSLVPSLVPELRRRPPNSEAAGSQL